MDCGRGLFASAHLIRAASAWNCFPHITQVPLPQHTSYELHPAGKSAAHLGRNLCLSTPHTSCIIIDAVAIVGYTSFASAHLIRAASTRLPLVPVAGGPLPQHTSYELHRWPQVRRRRMKPSLPQHTSYELHRQNCTEKWMQHCKMCCERVDSFSAT